VKFCSVAVVILDVLVLKDLINHASGKKGMHSYRACGLFCFRSPYGLSYCNLSYETCRFEDCNSGKYV